MKSPAAVSGPHTPSCARRAYMSRISQTMHQMEATAPPAAVSGPPTPTCARRAHMSSISQTMHPIEARDSPAAVSSPQTTFCARRADMSRISQTMHQTQARDSPAAASGPHTPSGAVGLNCLISRKPCTRPRQELHLQLKQALTHPPVHDKLTCLVSRKPCTRSRPETHLQLFQTLTKRLRTSGSHVPYLANHAPDPGQSFTCSCFRPSHTLLRT